MSSAKSSLERLQAAKSRADLAAILDIQLKDLTYLLYAKNPAEKYSVFYIQKKTGGSREISAPIPQIKSLQRRLADRLEECIEEIGAKEGFVNSSSHGFRRGKSILTNASEHRNKRYVLNLDLQDFFPTITGERIRGFFIKDTKFGFHKDVATTIAHIACWNGRLPQGSPCSPVISNLIAGILDFHLTRLAKKNGCYYTRYADDITFSTNKKKFPPQIARLRSKDENRWDLGNDLAGLISKAGFRVNEKKTRMQYERSRQVVTGLVVNNRINVTSEYRRLVRAYVFSYINHGRFETRRVVKGEGGLEATESTIGTQAQLHGMLGFIHSVDSVLRSDVEAHPYNYPYSWFDRDKTSGNLILFRRFLLFSRFYANSMPLIVCEGKTDGVYLSNAVHQCKDKFPSLVRKNGEGKDVLSFQLFKYARKHHKTGKPYLPNYSTAMILGVGSGGTPNMGNLIRLYHAEISRFRAPSGDHPVIFIVDNDKGGRVVYSIVKELLKIKISGEEAFVHLFANVYVVPVPLNGQKDSCIEDLFSKSDIDKGLNGKIFDLNGDDGGGETYGKSKFAYDFVAKVAGELDWTGFHPLLSALVGAQAHYSSVVAQSKSAAL